MDKQYGVVSVRFINKGNKLSSREYSYNVDEKLYKKLVSISFTYYDAIVNYKYYNKFLIVNENGYDYKNTPVVFTELYQGPYRGTGYSDKDLVFLSSYMYDGQTSIEVEEEKKRKKCGILQIQILINLTILLLIILTILIEKVIVLVIMT